MTLPPLYSSSEPPAPPRIVPGFPEDQRNAVAALFWEAFSAKLGRVMRPEAKALDFLKRALAPEFAISALDADGNVLGVAGIKTVTGGLVTSGFGDLAAAYGWAGALWRGPLLDLTERRLSDGQLLMDGLFVASRARGLGIGSKLVAEIVAEAARRGCREVRLDVVDTNPRARSLYERLGFVATRVEQLGPLRYVFGFRTSTTMVLRLGEPGAC
ncbi:MAG: GNAT family N-acetyltransferase [Pseudomonadota bacterium]